jgi:phage tail-like protein
MQAQATTLRVQLSLPSFYEAGQSNLKIVSGVVTQDGTAKAVWVQPGLPTTLTLRLENSCDRTKHWRFQTQIYSVDSQADQKAGFQAEWCTWQEEMQITHAIAPQQSLEFPLTICIPSDFFENQRALLDSDQYLLINYRIEVEVIEVYGEKEQSIGLFINDLWIRPNTTYLDFLPEFYRRNDFITRFLHIFEQAFDPYVQTVDQLWAYFNPLTAPEALLPFLAHWVGWDFDPHGDLQAQRHLIRNAIALYRWHGTRRGLRLYLHFYTGLPLDDTLPESEKHISIQEVLQGGFMMGDSTVGKDTMLGGGTPYHFSVRLQLEPETKIEEATIHQIIERQKPAFCTYDLTLIAP